MHIFFTTYSPVEAIVTTIGRLIQYHGVTFFIYRIIYWPYRLNLLPNGSKSTYDVTPFTNNQQENEYVLRTED